MLSFHNSHQAALRCSDHSAVALFQPRKHGSEQIILIADLGWSTGDLVGVGGGSSFEWKRCIVASIFIHHQNLLPYDYLFRVCKQQALHISLHCLFIATLSCHLEQHLLLSFTLFHLHHYVAWHRSVVARPLCLVRASRVEPLRAPLPDVRIERGSSCQFTFLTCSNRQK